MRSNVIDLATMRAIGEMHSAGCTQREIAEAMQCSQSTAWKYGRVPGHPERLKLPLQNGTVLIGSDAHYWPGEVTTAHKAFCQFANELGPDAIVLNGDVFDGASISRHPDIGWESRPTVKQELETVRERLSEIQHSVAYRPRLIWTLGNHDMRFETYLAAHAAEFKGVQGTHLKDHFPEWEPAWTFLVNDDIVIKHRFGGGSNAALTNTIRSGRSIVTGHLHRLGVSRFADYNGDRFGVECGTLADVYGPQFVAYTEDNPHDWASGFVLLTVRDGRLLWPEVAHVIGDGQVSWRGRVYNV